MILLEGEKLMNEFKVTEINKNMSIIEQINGEVYMKKNEMYIKLKNDLKEDEDYLSNKFYPLNIWTWVYTSTIAKDIERVEYGQAIIYEYYIYYFGGCSGSQKKCFNSIT